MRTFRTVLEQKIWERRQSLEEFAEYAEMFARDHKEPGTLGVRHLQRLAAGQGPKGQPLGPLKPTTARLLESIFGVSADELLSSPARPAPSDSASAGPPMGFDWLDENAGWLPDTSRQEVMSRLLSVSSGELLDRNARRMRVGRSQVAESLSSYYADRVSGCGTYVARVGDRTVATSVLTRPEWLDLACVLGQGNDRLRFASAERVGNAELGDTGAKCALERIVEASALGVRVTNVPLYRLLNIDVQPGAITGMVDVVPFIEYALTMDLLESEMVDAIAANVSARRSEFPLRDRCLPDLASVLDMSSRLCAGGALALCAIARPFDVYRGAPDYALLIQERSSHVVNATRRLAVIPKGFHQPMSDLRADAQISSTLRRKMEVELFGRAEVDSTDSDRRAAAPMHPSRLSEPMRWLTEDSERLHMECTAFGLNLVSGNYEFAGLIVIDDEEFWSRYGGQVEANWESAGLHLYSSLDSELITELVAKESWSNEGLFALLQGIRRLNKLGGDRVRLPALDWNLAGNS